MLINPERKFSSDDVAERLKLYLILETSNISLPLGDFIMQAIDGGVTAIQLRDKKHTPRDRYSTAKQLKSLINNKDILFIINNNIDIAKAVDADGVHVGIEDLPPDVVKQCFPNMIVGYSCNDLIDLQVAQEAGVDYIGIGPAYNTNTKENLRAVITPAVIKSIASNAKPIPSVAIGGIDLSNIATLKECDVNGVAISSALCTSDSPYDLAAEFIRLFS